jgi:hypothetical protein
MVLLGDVESENEYRYVERDGLYYAEKDMRADYLYYVRPGDGFGGRQFHIEMLNGVKRVLKGPWSSRAGCANALCMSEYYNSCLAEPRDAWPCSEVLFFTEPEAYKRGWTAYCGNLLLPGLLKAANLANVELLVKVSGDGWLSDTSGEQTDIITGGRRKYMYWEKWTEIPHGVEFNFCPSLSSTGLVKAKEENYQGLMSYRP